MSSAQPPSSLRGRLKSLGPGLLVTAAFVGPGTVTTSSIAGASTGFALLWALAFSIIATMVLQEMASRLGVVSRQGLGEAFRRAFANPILSFLVVALIVAAIAFGNAAFQTGNISGAGIGLEAVTGVPSRLWTLIVGVFALALLASGTYRVIERVLVVLVGVMSIAFVVTAVIVRPDLTSMLQGFVPSIPDGSLLLVVALIGSTVVPYNLFLHASSVQDKWPTSIPTGSALRGSRQDTVFSILVGGIIASAIVITAAAAFFGTGTEITDAGVMAQQLEPLLGPAARILFGLGLLAAGITSAATAPLAAAYATAGALGWERDLRSWRFRGVWFVILAVGTILAFLGEDPVAAIVFAQAANGILLPLIAVFLLVVTNRRDILGEHANGVTANVLGTAVVLVAAGLGVYQILSAFGVA